MVARGTCPDSRPVPGTVTAVQNRSMDDVADGLTGGSSRVRRSLRNRTRQCLERIETLADADVVTLRNVFSSLQERCRHRGDVTDDDVVEAIALASRASTLALGLTPYPVQVLAALVVASDHLAEMQTGEGKTLSIVLAAAALSLPARGVHVVTANDYLASRDALFLTPLAQLLGFSVGLSRPGMDDLARAAAHQADVTYGTARTFGYDYLNDALAQTREQAVCRTPYAVLLDEVDSVLLDDAAVPMLVSTATGGAIDFSRFTAVAAALDEADVHVDAAAGAVALLATGVTKAQAMLGTDDLYRSPVLVRRLQAALTARFLYRRDVDYIVVSDGDQPSVVLVDPRTGRRLTSRLGQALHEALESREGLAPRPLPVTRGRISVQSLFTRYPHLGGMSGTALACSDEFEEHYQRRVYRIPTNRPSRRVDHPDRYFATAAHRLDALRVEVTRAAANRQPVLVLADSVDACEAVGSALADLGDVRVLSARNPSAEADVIGRAGEPGAITVATLMAGRGVDIVLGGLATEDGFDERRATALAAGGLMVVSLARFPARRLDQQVRGRTGRQGEPGESRFLLSFDDDLPRRYAPEQMRSLLDQGSELPARLAARVFDRAQSRIEAEDVAARRAALRLDQLLHAQREELYRYRRELLALPAWTRAATAVTAALEAWLPERVGSVDELERALHSVWPARLPLTTPPVPATRGVITEHLVGIFLADLQQRLGQLTMVPPQERLGLLDALVGVLVMDCLDLAWAEHLEATVALQADAQMGSRFGQRADRVVKATLTKSFASRRLRFGELILLNLAGLQITGLRYKGALLEPSAQLPA